MKGGAKRISRARVVFVLEDPGSPAIFTETPGFKNEWYAIARMPTYA
jgi:hypothetical protein